MFLRLAMVAPLALAAALPAQLTTTKPVKPTTPAVLTEVQSPAEQLEMLKKAKARLQQEIKFATGLTDVIRSFRPDTKVKIKLLRDGKEKEIEVTLGSR